MADDREDLVDTEDETTYDNYDAGEVDVECTPGWEDRCKGATSKTCNCACGGHNHGLVLKAKLAEWRTSAG